MIRMEPVGVLVICLRVKLYSPDSKALLVTTRNINVKVKTFSLRILIFYCAGPRRCVHQKWLLCPPFIIIYPFTFWHVYHLELNLIKHKYFLTKHYRTEIPSESLIVSQLGDVFPIQDLSSTHISISEPIQYTHTHTHTLHIRTYLYIYIHTYTPH